MFLIADEVDAVATNLKNINTLKNDSGTLKGFNTDYYGFNKLITGKQLSNALIYGYGSVANTINFCLQEYGVKDIYIAGRNEERLEHFIKNKNLKKHKSNMNYDLLVNATPSGDKGDEVIDLLKYSNYLKKIMKKETTLIFDTIRPKYFENIFEYVEVVKEDLKTVHKSKRIACRGFK